MSIEAMNVWLGKDPSFRRQVIENIAFKTGMSPSAIEKDWWVSAVLKALFNTKCAPHLVFKGGTSLSKGWQLIERFSEDIDLAIDRTFFGFVGELNKTKKDKLRKKARKYVYQDLVVELNDELLKLGLLGFEIEIFPTTESDLDPTVFHVNYKSIFPITQYIPNRVKVEMNCRSLREPFQAIKMRSVIANNYPDADFADTKFCVNTVLPTRTFLEKAFLLHEEFKKNNIRSDRMTRHLYDLEKLMDTSFAEAALQDISLYITVVKHRYAFTKIGGIDYSHHHPSTIDFVPPVKIRAVWQKDYENMIKNFIYGKYLSFGELIERIEILRERFRKITITDDFFMQERK